FIPEEVRAKCPDADSLAEDIRVAAGAYLKENNRAAGNDTLSLEYGMLSSVLREAVRFERAEQRQDLYLGAEVEKVLRAHGCRAASVSVFGRRKKQFYATGISAGIPENVRKALKKDLEKAAKCALTDPILCRMGDEEVLTFASAKTLSVQNAVACRSADGEVVCGDSVRFFESEDDRFYATLSDGMGSGERAAALSALCTAFFEKTLSAGITKNQAAKLFHSLLRAGESERSTTLDLFELDLLSGDAVFLKAGAAPSFVVRDGQLFRIRSKTIPMGLTKEPDTEKIRFSIEEGDLVVLLSDGICQTPEDAPWLQALLSADVSEKELSALCAKILSAAAENAPRSDDMTVAILRVQNCQL
ncbi:MAG: SpoIIE family protein phosphatase, partial [Clostridia bacterium]|nr:SpoIIE family protein phosphatase [Clostridia bacterium]